MVDEIKKPKLTELMKAAQEMQSNMKAAHEALIKLEVLGEAGAGMVKITMNGRHDVTRVELDPDLIDEDIETMQDLIASACNDANRKIEKASQEKMMELAKGFKMPEGMVQPKESGAEE